MFNRNVSCAIISLAHPASQPVSNLAGSEGLRVERSRVSNAISLVRTLTDDRN